MLDEWHGDAWGDGDGDGDGTTTTTTTTTGADDETGEPPPSNCGLEQFELDANNWNIVELGDFDIDSLCSDLGTIGENDVIRVRVFSPGLGNWPADALPLLVFGVPPEELDSDYVLSEYDDILEPIADAGVVVLLVQRLDAPSSDPVEDPVDHAADGILCGLRWLTTDDSIHAEGWERGEEARAASSTSRRPRPATRAGRAARGAHGARPGRERACGTGS